MSQAFDLKILREHIKETEVYSYQVNAIVRSEARKSFKGARVLEVGGHNIPASVKFDLLGAERWICCDLVQHGSGNYQSYSPHPNSNFEGGVISTGKVTLSDLEKKSLFATGDISDLPTVFNSRFDVIFSIAAFEHINRIPRALKSCYNALVEGGMLYSEFSPIWSARGGHHCNDPRVTKYNALEPWDHLLLSQPQMYEKLIRAGLDDHMAAHTVAWVYNSPTLNRLFFEDYVSYMKLSPFKKWECLPGGESTSDEKLIEELRAHNPGYLEFGAYGATIVGWR